MIPKEYYNQAEPDIKMTTASIKRGSTLHLEYQIDLPNSLLRYACFTARYLLVCSHLKFELPHDKLCTQRRLRSAWVSLIRVFAMR